MRALDAVLPEFDVNEVHAISLPCTPKRAVEVALAAPAAPDRLVAILFRVRGLAPATTIGALFERMRFETIESGATEIVFGASGTPWRPSGGICPLAAAGPGTVRIAADLRAIPIPGGCVLSTETRIHAVDDGARRAFRRYWFAVGPFSSLIRRRWLKAVGVATSGDEYGRGGARS